MTFQSRPFAAAAALLSFTATIAGHEACAEEQNTNLRNQIVGTWTLRELQSVTWDEHDRNPFGSSPKGRMILDGHGNVTCVIIGADRPKFALGDRLSGTPEENMAVVHSTQAFFGTYRL